MINTPDTLEKIVRGYFAALTKKPFTFRGEEFHPKPLLVSPLLFRGYTCPISCGGCCAAVSLIWLPTESQPEGLSKRTIEFQGRELVLMEDPQGAGPKCKHLHPDDGRCGIHGNHPMPCDFELIKLIHYSSRSLLISKKYGRGHAFHRVDGGRGSMCEMTPVTDETRAEVVRKLRRVREWILYFGLDTWIDDIISWAEAYPSVDGPLLLGASEASPLLSDGST